MTKSAIALIVAPLLAIACVAHADEAMRTASDQALPAAIAAAHTAPPLGAASADPNSPDAIGAWARGVIYGEPPQAAAQTAAETPAKSASRCEAMKGDGKPHGEVWGGIGTHGYREAGGVVTQPIGDCGQLTLMINRVEGGGFRGRR